MATEKTPVFTDTDDDGNRAGVLYSLAVGAVFAAVSTAAGVLIGLTMLRGEGSPWWSWKSLAVVGVFLLSWAVIAPCAKALWRRRPRVGSVLASALPLGMAGSLYVTLLITVFAFEAVPFALLVFWLYRPTKEELVCERR